LPVATSCLLCCGVLSAGCGWQVCFAASGIWYACVLVSRPLSGCDAARQPTAPCPSQTWSCCMWHYDVKSRLVKLGLRSPCYQSGHGSAASMLTAVMPKQCCWV
jgi:hypothetical protein